MPRLRFSLRVVPLIFFAVTASNAFMSLEEVKEDINEYNLKWRAESTSIAGLSDEDFKSLLGWSRDYVDKEVLKSHTVYEEAPQVQLPDSFDWRNVNGHNWMTPVKDQLACGSCWAFAIVGAFEPNIKITFSAPDLDLDLSEQDLVSCDC